MPSPRAPLRPHAPLMWVMLALMAGYGAAEACPWMVAGNRGVLFLLGVIGVGAAALLYRGANTRKNKSRKPSPTPQENDEPENARAKSYFTKSLRLRLKFYAAIGVGALAALYYNYREARTAVAFDQLAPREATLLIEPVQSFALRSDSGREAGLGVVRGIISSGPISPSPLIGKKINYSVRWNLKEPLETGAWIKMKGVLAPNQNLNGGFDEYLERSHVPWGLSQGVAISVEKVAAPLPHLFAQLHTAAVEVLQRRWGQNDITANNHSLKTHPLPPPTTDMGGDKLRGSTPAPRASNYSSNQTNLTSPSGLLPAMVIGDKADLTREQKENFVRSGTMHLVAVSGLNVMAVAFVLWGLVKLLPIQRAAQAGLVVGALGIYSMVAGAGPSVLRAWGMVAIALLMWGLRRQMNLWAVVVLAATISLIIEPLSFLHAGWRLSFGVVGGIVLGMGALERWRASRPPMSYAQTQLKNFSEGGRFSFIKLFLRTNDSAPPKMRNSKFFQFILWIGKFLRGIWRGILQTCTIGLVAGIAVAPMTAAYWGLAQPLGFLVNAAAVTLAGFVTILGTLSWVVAWIPLLAETLNELSYGLLGVIDAVIKGYLKIPGSVVEAAFAKQAGVEIWGTLLVLGVFYAVSRWGWRRQ